MAGTEKNPTRRPGRRTCYITTCRNSSTTWILRHEGALDAPNAEWVEAKVCAAHARGQQKAKNQNG